MRIGDLRADAIGKCSVQRSPGVVLLVAWLDVDHHAGFLGRAVFGPVIDELRFLANLLFLLEAALGGAVRVLRTSEDDEALWLGAWRQRGLLAFLEHQARVIVRVSVVVADDIADGALLGEPQAGGVVARAVAVQARRGL